VIVLDLMMPIMDGRTVVDRCRAESLCADVPIVVVSVSHNLRSAASRPEVSLHQHASRKPLTGRTKLEHHGRAVDYRNPITCDKCPC